VNTSHTVTNLALSSRLDRLFRTGSRLFRSPFVVRPIQPTQFIELNMLAKRTQGGFYAVRTGRKVGVFETWYYYYLSLKINTSPIK
jgi:hypothetical protein